MKNLFMMMAAAAFAIAAKADYTTYSYFARVDGLDSDCTGAVMSIYDASNNSLLSSNITSENLDTKGKSPSKSISFESGTQPDTVYCQITTTTASGDVTWKSQALAFSTDYSTSYLTPMYRPETYREMSWTLGSNPAANGWSSITTVPEPSSGLLVLLGLSGLALRRRRA